MSIAIAIVAAIAIERISINISIGFYFVI